MKKYLILFLFASISFISNAQVQSFGLYTNHVQTRGALLVDSMMRLPVRDTIFPTWYAAAYEKGSLIIKNSDTSLYYHNGTKWGKVGGSSIDTTSLSNRIDSKAGLTVPNNIFTGKITMGTSTGTGLLNFPDAGTTSTDGISFGSSVTNLYRKSPSIIQTDGTLSVLGSIINQSTGKLALGDLNNITISPTSLTGSLATSAINLTQTWNTTGNPTAIFANIINTASGSASNLIDLQVGSASKFKVDKNGGINCMGISTFNSNILINGLIAAGGTVDMRLVNPNTTKSVVVSQDYSFSSSSSSLFEVSSTTKGMLPPRMTTAQRMAISSPTEGLEVYDLSYHAKMTYDGTRWTGYRFNGLKFQGFDGTNWVDLN